MPKVNSATPPTLHEAPLPDAIYTHIGKLVRLFADFEELVYESLAARLKMQDDQVKLLVGNQGLSKSIELLLYSAKSISEDCFYAHNMVMERISEYRNIRNIAAHGIYIGKTDDGKFTFSTNRLLQYPGAGKIHFEISAFDEDALKAAITGMEAILPLIPEHWQLLAWRKKRSPRRLLGHPKAPNARQRREGQKPRRKSSPS